MVTPEPGGHLDNDAEAVELRRRFREAYDKSAAAGHPMVLPREALILPGPVTLVPAEQVAGPSVPRPVWLAMLGIMLTMVSLTVGTMLWSMDYARDTVRESDRQFCALLGLSAQDDPPPTTARGREAYNEARRLVREFGCPE